MAAGRKAVAKVPAGRGAAKAVKKTAAKPGAGPRAKAPPFRKNGIDGVQLIMAGQPARRLGVLLESASRTKITARLPIRPTHMNRGQRVNEIGRAHV